MIKSDRLVKKVTNWGKKHHELVKESDKKSQTWEKSKKKLQTSEKKWQTNERKSQTSKKKVK